MTFLSSNDGSEDPLFVKDIFCTEPGKRFGEQVGQVLEFAIKGLTLTAALPAIAEYAQDILQALAKKSISKAIDKAKKNPHLWMRNLYMNQNL